MLSKQVTKIVQNLEKKKFREKYNLFKIEGEKLVGDLLHSSLEINTLIATSAWLETHRERLKNTKIYEADEHEIGTLTNFQSPPAVIALAKIPEYHVNEQEIVQDLSLVLNGIQDPGNMGTILRVADWFGIRQVFCDQDCANIYNPKCVQASMGAIFRVHTFYIELTGLLKKYKNKDLSVFGTFLDGENIYTSKLERKGFIVMGNEGKGISDDIREYTDTRLTIPGFSIGPESMESLNVGVATGIILSEFRRRTYE